jgi:hypothetical protein
MPSLCMLVGGIDYGHGTGHGVGAYLNVHEGPHSISFRRRENEPALEKGMTTSIEPGYYQEVSLSSPSLPLSPPLSLSCPLYLL